MNRPNVISSHQAAPLPGLIERLSAALRKLSTSTSQQLGGDCAAHAYLAQQVLADHGVQARVVFGVAAWRIGPGDGDVISHIPQFNPALLSLQPKAFPYHAWLETDSAIIDFSTHTLGLKASQLDAQDGGHTTVAWCPDYLFLKMEEVKTFEDVAQAPLQGVAFYQEVPELLDLLKLHGFAPEVSEVDLNVLRMIVRNPDIHVMGVNDIELQAA